VVVSRTVNHNEDTDESPEDSFAELLVVCGVSGLLVVGLVICIPLLLILL
jgi:hypothetical protein